MAEIRGAISITDSGADLLIQFASTAKRKSINVEKAGISLVINTNEPDIVYLNHIDGRSYVLDYTQITAPVVASAEALRNAISDMFDTGGADSAPANKISTSNSSTAALENGNTFIGDWEDVSAYGVTSVAVSTDQHGTLTVEYSPDGVNVDSTLTRYYRTNQIEAPFPFVNGRQYMRVKFLNDSGSNQTYLRLQTLLGSFGQLRAPLDSTMAQDFDAVAVRPSSFQDEVSLGKRQGVIEVAQFGHDEDQQQVEGMKTIWDQPTSLVRPTIPQTVTVTSTSPNDTLVGTGAQKVTIYGINDMQERDSEEIDLGATSIKIWLGIDLVEVSQAGATGYNEGDITVTADIDGTPQSFILTDHAKSLQAFYYIPKDHVLIINRFLVNAAKPAGGGTSPKVGFRFFSFDLDTGIRQEIDQLQLDTDSQESITVEDRVNIKGPALLEQRAETDQNGTFTGGRILGNLYRDVDAP